MGRHMHCRCSGKYLTLVNADKLCLSIIHLQILTVLGAAFVTMMVSVGAGKHMYSLSDPRFQALEVVKWNYPYEVVNIIAVNMVKVSILLFILRIQNDKRTKIVIWATICVMTVVNLITDCAIAAQCIPADKLWNPTKAGTCFKPGQLSQFGYAQSVFSVLTDAFCTISPIFILWNVQIRRRIKIVIWSLMSVGVMATACNIIRSIYLNTLNADDISCKWQQLSCPSAF